MKQAQELSVCFSWLQVGLRNWLPIRDWRALAARVSTSCMLQTWRCLITLDLNTCFTKITQRKRCATKRLAVIDGPSRHGCATGHQLHTMRPNACVNRWFRGYVHCCRRPRERDKITRPEWGSFPIIWVILQFLPKAKKMVCPHVKKAASVAVLELQCYRLPVN